MSTPHEGKKLVHNDTVDAAKATPEQEQPYAALGLKDDEYARIREILGRRPTDAELTVYSVMWSEHCSYKSSKVHLRYFGETMTEEMGAKPVSYTHLTLPTNREV